MRHLFACLKGAYGQLCLIEPGMLLSRFHLVEKPDAPFAFVDPDFKQTRRRHISVLIANIVNFAQNHDELPVVFSQFTDHVLRGYIRRVIVCNSLESCDMGD